MYIYILVYLYIHTKYTRRVMLQATVQYMELGLSCFTEYRVDTYVRIFHEYDKAHVSTACTMQLSSAVLPSACSVDEAKSGSDGHGSSLIAH